MNILVIDDEPVIGELFKRCLGKEGHDVTVCDKGVPALDIISTGNLDLIFLDLMLPDLGGVEIFKHIRRTNEDTHVVIITGLYESDQVNMAMAYQPFVILKKPFTIDTVQNIVSILEPGQKYKAEVH